MTTTYGDVSFGPASAFGAPPIGGVDVTALSIPAFGANGSLRIDPQPRPADGLIEDWAIGLDLYVPTLAPGAYMSLLQLGDGDGELFLRDDGAGAAGIGISGVYEGTIPYGAWTRVVATFTVENGATILRKYVNGALVGEQDLGATSRWTVDATKGLRLFADNDGETAPALVSSVFFTQEVPSAPEVAGVLATYPTPTPGAFFPGQPSATALELGFEGETLALRYGAADVIVEGAGFRTPVAIGDSLIGYASQFGIEGPGGVDAPVLKAPAYADDEGLRVTLPAGTPDLSSWTMIWDVRVGPLTSGWFALLQTDVTQSNDGELFLNGSREVGIGGNYDGTVPVDAWARIAVTVADKGDGTSTLTKYLDGKLLDSQSVDAARFTLDAANGFLLLTDNDGETSPAYLAHVAASARVLSDAEIAALGGADADGPFAPGSPFDAQLGFDGYAPSVEFGFGDVTLLDATPATEPEVANPIRDMLVAAGDAPATFDLAEVFGPGASGFAVTNSNGEAVAATIENGVLTLAFGALGVADLVVSATDAEGRLLEDNVRVRVAGEGAYAIAIMPDTQDYTSNGAITPTFANMTTWIADNAASKNIGFVVHVGDITQTAQTGQFEIAHDAMDVLRAAGVPFSVLPGNHDIGPGGSSTERTTSPYNVGFSVAYMSQDPTYAGSYDQEPERYDNNYHLWTAPDGTEWIFLNLEFGPRDDVLRWADDVLTQHADRLAMVSTHSYNNWEGRHDSLGGPLQGEGAGYDYGLGTDPRGAQDGETLWREVLSKHANVVFTAGGHIFGDGAETVTSYDAFGNPAFQFLVNYQNGVALETTGAGDAAQGGDGGNGAMRIVIVDPANDAVYTETYFTELDTYFTGWRGQEARDRDGLTGPYVGHEETLTDARLDRTAEAVADAGDDILAEAAPGAETAEVALSAARTSNPNGETLAFRWEDADGATLAESAEATLDLGAGIHDLTLVVTAPDGVESRDRVRVIVKTDAVHVAETFDDGDANGWVPPEGEGPTLATTGTDLGFGLPALSGAAQRTLTLAFDSHWRPEGTQTARVLVSIDGAAPAEILRYDSATTADDGAEQNERVELDFLAPEAAQSVQVFFRLSDAGNNWFWAIDNLSLTDESGAALLAEDFDGLADALQPAVDENIPATTLGWTQTTPDGWSIDTADTTPQGTTEWQGWSFATLPFWTAADGQDRGNFTRASGVFAVADPDEWDDFNGGTENGRDYDSTLATPAIDLGGAGDAEAAGVASVQALGPDAAILVKPDAAGAIATYTLVYDLHVAADAGPWTSLFQTDVTNASDGELFLRNAGGGVGGVGISGSYDGPFRYDAWSRVAFAFSVENGAHVLRKYIDGELRGAQVVDGNVADGSRWIVDAEAGFLLFSDNDGETTPLHVGAFAFAPVALTDAEIAALGAADADGPLAGAPAAGAFQLSFDGALDALDFGAATVEQIALGASGTPFFVKGSAASRAAGDGLAAPQGKLYDQSNAADNLLLWKDGAFGDFVLDATLNSLDDDAMGVAFGYADAANHYRLTLDNEQNLRRLVKIEGAVETVLAEETGGYRFYDDVALRVTVEDGAVTASLDGVALFSGPVALGGAAPVGRIGLYSSGQRSATFDDIVVRDPAPEAVAGPRRLLIDFDGDGVETLTLDGRLSVGAAGASAQWSGPAGALGAGLLTEAVAAAGRTTFTLALAADGATDADSATVAVASGARLLAADRFDDGEASDWRMVDASETGGPADWAVVDGALVERSGAASRELTWSGASHPDVWQRGWSPHGDGVFALHRGAYALKDFAAPVADLSVEARVEVPVSGGVGFVFAWTDVDNHYKIEIDDRVNLITLVKVVDGYEDLLARVRGNYTTGDAFHFRVERVDDRMQAWIDGHELFAKPVEDRALEAGSAGLFAWGAAGASFDDVAMVDLSTPFETARAVVSGSARNDRLSGTDGDDRIASGAGRRDVSAGGDGSDLFVFGPESRNGVRETDQIRDYDAAEGDLIDLGDATVASVRETRAAVRLTLDGDGDVIVVGGVSDMDQILFA